VNTAIIAALLAVAPQMPLQNIRCTDGDTIVADIVLGFGLVLHNQDIRLYAYDAWEASRRRQTVHVTDDEIVKGGLARLALEKLLREAKTIRATEVPGRRDPYGRTLLCIYADGIEVGGALRAMGHERISP
jgi:endonuclease YncB( thermonuclease family)